MPRQCESTVSQPDDGGRLHYGSPVRLVARYSLILRLVPAGVRLSVRDLCLTVTEGHHNHKIKREGSHVGGHMSDSLTMDVGGGKSIQSSSTLCVCLLKFMIYGSTVD